MCDFVQYVFRFIPEITKKKSLINTLDDVGEKKSGDLSCPIWRSLARESCRFFPDQFTLVDPLEMSSVVDKSFFE